METRSDTNFIFYCCTKIRKVKINFPFSLPGFTVFRGIAALDRDKPNTANSEITYSIIKGNEQRKFSLEGRSSKMSVLVLRKPLDWDQGEKFFNLTIRAQVRPKDPGRRKYSMYVFEQIAI